MNARNAAARAGQALTAYLLAHPEEWEDDKVPVSETIAEQAWEIAEAMARREIRSDTFGLTLTDKVRSLLAERGPMRPSAIEGILTWAGVAMSGGGVATILRNKAFQKAGHGFYMIRKIEVDTDEPSGLE